MNNNIKCYGSSKIFYQLRNKNPLFLCVIASTKTSNIDGITGAGATSQLTDYTPAADVELVICGEPRCLPEIPKTVVGGEATPTPAVITKAALELADIPIMVADAGASIKPNLPYININDKPGEDIRTGKVVSNAERIFKKGKIIGKTLSKLTDHLIIGESTPAGTTTALGVLTAMGYDAQRKVSGSTPENPHTLKQSVVEEGLKSAGYGAGDLRDDPFKAIEVVGDPMIPAVAGLTVGSEVPVTLAGGTQMTAITAVIRSLAPEFDLNKICIATTIFVAEDETSDINYISRQISNTPIYAIDPEFEKSTHEGLKNYLKGSVKEGVGAGGAMMAAILKDIAIEDLRAKIEDLCFKLF
ncbi:MAG: TIGR00303 family protein [Euryarchaeota archaeon]|nr:TIGR00303 family protein [Euryarchaeota archaeon]